MLIVERKIDDASGQFDLVPATALKYGLLLRLLLVMPSSTTVVIKDAATALTGAMTLPNMVLDFTGQRYKPVPWFTTSAVNRSINVTLGSAIQASGRAWYALELRPTI